MQIRNGYNLSFGASRMNIVSLADTHGDMLGIPQTIKTIQENKDDIFERKDDNSTQNVMAVAGDFFMNPGGRGLITNPQKSVGDVQYNFFGMMVYEVGKLFNDKNKFKTLYTPGNHCFGGGDGWLFNRLFYAPFTTILGNVDEKKSPYVAKLMKKAPKIHTHQIFEIPDDKNPEIKSHVLFLGVTIPSSYYNVHNIKYTKFLDQTDKNDAAIAKSDLKQTIKYLRSAVKDFKKQYPNGAVVLMSHTGNKISEYFAQSVPGINVILNGHDHKDFVTLVNGTQILSLGQNNNFVRGIRLTFDDEGKLSVIKNQKYSTAPYIKKAREDAQLQHFVEAMLKKDLEPLVKFDKNMIESDELLFSNKIRYQNSVLMNYITSAIKHSARERYPEVDIAGVPATIIRSGLRSNRFRTTFNNIDLINMFKGADESVAGNRIGTITGKELAYLVVENVRNNIKSPTRNALVQWSDIQINRTKIAEAVSKKEKVDFAEAVKIRNSKTKEYEPIDFDKDYTILLSDKYLIKNSKKIRIPAKIIGKFKKIPESYGDLFKQYLQYKNGKVRFTDKHREQRII